MHSALAERIMRVLLVEDNPGDIRLLKEAIGRSGVRSELQIVDNGEDAIAYLRQEGPYRGASRPDLVLLDLNLPRKDGRDVLAEVKEDTELRRIPVVVLTTSQSDQDVQKVHDLHATILHLLGFDHTKLTYRFQGRDFRLTDVHGNVVKELLA